MLTVDRLRLRLPPGLEARAESIALKVAEVLAESPVAGDLSLDSLTVGPVKITSATDEAVVEGIAGAIRERLAMDRPALPATWREK
jgi:hypothetical protein